MLMKSWRGLTASFLLATLLFQGCGSSGGSSSGLSSGSVFGNGISGLNSANPGPGTGDPSLFGPGSGPGPGPGGLQESPPESITPFSSSLFLEVGDTELLSFVITLEDGTDVSVNPMVVPQTTIVNGVQLSYESLNPGVATVDSEAKVTAVGTGITAVRVTATSGREGSTQSITLDVPVAVGQPRQFFYVANPTPNGGGGWVTILGIFRDGRLGVVEDRVSNPGRPLGLFRSPDGRFVYTINVSSANITVYEVTEGTGLLTKVGENIPVGTSSNPRGLCFTRDGRYAYTIGSGGQLYGFLVEPNGRLTPLSITLPDAGGAFFAGPVIHRNHLYAIDVEAGPGRVRVFSIGTDGALTYQSEALGVGRTFGFSFSSNGRYAYLGTQSNSISGFRVEDNGDLTPLSPATTPSTANGPTVVKCHPNLGIVYVITSGDNLLSTYRIDPSTGALTLMNSIVAGSDLLGMIIDLTGSFAYVPRGDYDFSTFTLASDGVPTRGADFDDPSIDFGFAGSGAIIDNVLNRAVSSWRDREPVPVSSVGL